MTYATAATCIALGVAVGFVLGWRSVRGYVQATDHHFRLTDTAVGQHGRALRRIEDRLKALERVR